MSIHTCIQEELASIFFFFLYAIIISSSKSQMWIIQAKHMDSGFQLPGQLWLSTFSVGSLRKEGINSPIFYMLV